MTLAVSPVSFVTAVEQSSEAVANQSGLGKQNQVKQ